MVAPRPPERALVASAPVTVDAGGRRFLVALAVIGLGAFALRMAYAVLFKWDGVIWGDAFYYHYQANGLAEGRGFELWLPFSTDRVAPAGPTADHPPLFPMYLGLWSLAGLTSWHWHVVANVVVGTAAVVVCGLVGREVAGERAGLVAAGVAAVYANLWVHDPLVMSESITILMTAVCVLLAYRFWRSPTLGRALALGAAAGAVALARSEVALFLVFAAIPLALVARGVDRRRRLTMAGAMCAAAGLVVAPWLVRNLTAFEHPLLLSGQLDIGLAATNCDPVYHGPALGWWDQGCLFEGQPSGDPSEQARYWREVAVDYVRDNTGRVPVVLAARLGRIWELYRPGSPWGEINDDQKIHLDLFDGRDADGRAWPARVALAQWFVLAPLAVVGGVVLWRRRVTVVPFVALVALVSCAALVLYGNTRFRTPAEVGVVVLAAVAVDAALRRVRRRRPPPAPAGGEPVRRDEPADAVGAQA